MPDGIVELRAIDPSIRVAMMYATPDNFLGRPAAGYRDDLCYLTRPAAEALRAAQARLVARRPDHALLVRDCYRPQRAVDDFVAWTRDPAAAATKARFYPDVDKRHLVRDGYIAATSTHTRGGTVDLTIVGPDGRPLDMGTPVDYFGPESHRDHAGVTPAQRAARALLRAVMAPDFRGYAKEWWHFTLRDAPPFDPPPEFEVARPRSR